MSCRVTPGVTHPQLPPATIATVRRLILITLLIFMPIQFVWGAAASYCMHEEGAAVQHFGHHAHKHQGKSQTSSESSQIKKVPVGDDDPDCPTCHLGCVHPVVATLLSIQPDVMDAMRFGNSEPRPHLVQSTIERPNWTLAA